MFLFGKVNYIYQNNAIYFSEEIKENQIDELILHECIHFLQDARNIDGSLNRIGLCHFSEFKVTGLGLNEAAVQYIASQACGKEVQKIEQDDLFYVTLNQKYYPLLTSVFLLLTYLLPEEYLVDCTINSRQNFQEYLWNMFEEDTQKILNQFDMLLDLELRIKQRKKTRQKKVNQYKQLQALIVFSYFSKIVKYTDSIEQLEKERAKLDRLQEIIQKNHIYERQKIEIEELFDQKLSKLYKQKNRLAMMVISQNKLTRFFQKIVSYLTEK